MNSNQPIRKRIVINLDPASSGSPARATTPGAPSTRSRRWPRVLALIGALLIIFIVVAAGAGYLWWRHYQTTPAYSLALVIDAAQRDDMAAFDKQIDDEEIAKNMVANVKEKAADRYGLALSGTLQGQIDRLLPSLLPRLKQTLRDEVSKEIKEFAANSKPKPFIIVALAVPSLVAITNEGDSAKASTGIQDRTIELTMQRYDDRWKITNLKDDVLIQRVVDNLMKEMPPIGGFDPRIPLLKTPGRRGSKPAQR